MTENFVVEGIPPLEPLQEISVGEILYQSLLSHKEKHPAFTNGSTRESLTYAQLLSRTCSLAEALRSCGYGPETTILVSSKNDLQFYVPVIASLYIGAVVTTANPDYTTEELNNAINISKPNILFCSKDQVQKYWKIKENTKFIERLFVLNDDKSSLQAECLDDFIGRTIKSVVSRISTTVVNTKEHTAFILNSSGTTGLPKGVMLTHRNIITMFYIMKDPRVNLQHTTSLCVPPFFHGYGLLTTLASLSGNIHTVFLTEFAPKVFLRSIQDYKVNKLYLAPAVVVFLAKSPLVFDYDLTSVKETLCGAAPLKKSTEDEFKKRLNVSAIRQAYGLTESTLALTVSGSGPIRSKPGSSGKVMQYCRVAIRDLETGKFLGPNKIGEICVKSEMVMKGYCGNPEATRNTFTKDGWLLTGDIGYYDEDKDFFITDRLKELIKYKGFQVAPAELEALLLTHPEIRDSGVVGVEDERGGEVPLAFVVKSEKSNLTEQDVQEFVKGKLSNQKWLRGGVIFVESVPKSPIGKVLRRELRLMLKQYRSKL